MNELTTANPAEVAKTNGFPRSTVAEIKQNVKDIQELMRDVMVKGAHYDTLPGCGNKPILLKPGAESILLLFSIGCDPAVTVKSDGFDSTYRVKVKGFSRITGAVVGYGVGEASTAEKKYKWRAAVCDEEYDDTPETRRQVYYSRDRNGHVSKVKQVRQNPADIGNTVLKMAKKRALVDFCLTATACSDIFVQDVDDPDTAEATGVAEPPPRYQAPQQKAPAPYGDVISDAQRKRLYAIGKGRELTDEEMSFIVHDTAGVDRSDAISRQKYDEVVANFEKAVHGQVL